jgi:PAS domain S-box-containing protein
MKAAHPDQNSLFLLAVEHSPIAMGLADPDGRFRVVNDALAKLLGRDRSELLRTTWQSITHPDDLAATLATHRQLLEGQCDHYRLTSRVRHVDGRVVWIDLTVSAVQEPDGPPIAALFQVVDITGMVQSRQQTADERERFRLLAELGCDLVVMLDTNLQAVWLSSNSEGRNCLGWPAEAEQGVRLDQRVHPDDLPRVAELTAALLATGQWPDDCLLRMQTASGGYRWMGVKAAPVRGADGAISGYVSGLRDVDELVRTRQQAEKQQKRLQATLDSLLDPHAVIEPVRDSRGTVVDFRYLAANAMTCQAVGVPLEKLLGARVLPLVPALRDPHLFARYVHTLESGEPLLIDNLVLSEGMGRPTRHYDLRVVKQNDSLVATWRDVSERTEMGETIDLLTRSSGELVVRLDLDGVIRWVSPSLPSLLGWQPQEWLGRRGSKFLDHGGTCPGYQESRQRLLVGESMVCHDRIRARDGSLHWLESYITPYRNLKGAIQGMVLACRLIDEQVAAREALVRKGEELKQKLRTSLSAAAIAHEIKKPLSLLLLHSEMAQRQIEIADGAPKPLEMLVGQIQQEARTVVSTIERMNALLRSVPTEPQGLDLGTVVRSSLLYQRPQLQRRGIEVETAGLDAPCPIHGDGGQLQIALNNLIENAFEALGDPPPPGSRLRLSLQQQEYEVLLAVEDSGPGFSDLALEQLPLRTTKPQGTGLGLYLVEQICSNHGGLLEVGRSSLGGASVRMHLPLDRVPPAPA